MTYQLISSYNCKQHNKQTFNSNYLNNLLEKVSKEQKPVFLLDNFNINLLNYNVHNPSNEFLGSLTSNYFTLHLAAKQYY